MLKLVLGSIAVIAAIAIVAVIAINIFIPKRFDVPVAIVVCAQQIDLSAIDPDVPPAGCERAQGGLDLTMANPDATAHRYEDGFFGFRRVEEQTNQATLTVSNTISQQPIAVVIESNGGNTTTTLELQSEGSWSGSFELSPDVDRIVIVIVTSPITPPTLA